MATVQHGNHSDNVLVWVWISREFMADFCFKRHFEILWNASGFFGFLSHASRFLALFSLQARILRNNLGCLIDIKFTSFLANLSNWKKVSISDKTGLNLIELNQFVADWNQRQPNQNWPNLFSHLIVLFRFSFWLTEAEAIENACRPFPFVFVCDLISNLFQICPKWKKNFVEKTLC